MYRSAAVFLLIFSVMVDAAGGDLLIEDVVLIDGTGRQPVSHVSILVRDDSIVEIKKGNFDQSVRKTAQVINGAQKYLIPGLMDVHVHLAGSMTVTEQGLREVEIDACMFALSFVDCHIYNFEEVVLPLARAQNAGVAAMKVYGGTIGMDYHKPRPSELANSGFDDHERALRYALGLPGVSLAVIGVYNEEELVQNIEWMRRYTPLDAGEQQTLLALGRGFARQWGPHYGPVE